MAQSMTLPNAQQLAGTWNRMKGQFREKWGQLTDDDLERFKGNVDQLIGYIQQKTGEHRNDVESFLSECYEKAGGAVQRIGDRVSEYSGRAAETIQGQYEQWSGKIGEASEQAQQFVRQRPAESIAVAFGAGVLSGLLLTLVMRAR